MGQARYFLLEESKHANSVEDVINPPRPLHIHYFSVSFHCEDPYIPSFSGDDYYVKVPFFFSTKFSSLIASFGPM